MILLIDNYDSFVFNLARYFERLGQETLVVRNDQVDVAEIRRIQPAAVVLSPGPCGPEQAGCSIDVVRELHAELPILGVCLGHQVIAAALGGTVSRSSEPVHGRDSLVFHGGDGIFAGLPNPLRCGRYHSLIVDEKSLADDLKVLARTAEGTVMAIAHRTLPVVGLQFHPESILTECGYDLLAAFFRQAGLTPAQTPLFNDERREAIRGASALPSTPVTF